MSIQQTLINSLVAFLSVIAAVVLASCGSSGDGAATSTVAQQPLTKAQFVERGNEICRKGLEEKEDVLLAAGEKLSPEQQEAPSKQTLEELVGASLPPLKATLVQLNNLPPPEGETDAVEEILSAYDAAMSKAEGSPQLLIRNEPFARANEQANNYGLAFCSF